MIKLLRILRIIKYRSLFLKYIHSFCNLGLVFERLIFISIIFGLCCHVITCIWITTYYFESETTDGTSWVDAYSRAYVNIDGHPNYQPYKISLYFIITTMTSVGYSDIAS